MSTKSTAQKSGGSHPISHGVGRRKASVARVWLRPGSGAITVNGRPAKEYFTTITAQNAIILPLHAVNKRQVYDVEVNVTGGGVSGQADATKLGISRALFAADAELKATLRQHGLLTVDARLKERKKYGQRGARAKFQFVKR